MTEDEVRPGDVVLDGRRQAYLRLKGGGWRHLDMVLVESGQRSEPEGDLVLLQRKSRRAVRKRPPDDR
jgi:hypothetical protein